MVSVMPRAPLEIQTPVFFFLFTGQSGPPHEFPRLKREGTGSSVRARQASGKQVGLHGPGRPMEAPPPVHEKKKKITARNCKKRVRLQPNRGAFRVHLDPDQRWGTAPHQARLEVWRAEIQDPSAESGAFQLAENAKHVGFSACLGRLGLVEACSGTPCLDSPAAAAPALGWLWPAPGRFQIWPRVPELGQR